MYKIKKKRVKKITQKLKAAGDGGNKNESGARLKQPSDAELEEESSKDNHNGTSNAKNVPTSNATDGHEPNFSWNGVIQLLEEYQGNENTVSSKPKIASTSTTAPGMHTNAVIIGFFFYFYREQFKDGFNLLTVDIFTGFRRKSQLARDNYSLLPPTQRRGQVMHLFNFFLFFS